MLYCSWIAGRWTSSRTWAKTHLMMFFAASRGLPSHEAVGGLIFDFDHAQVLEEFNWTVPQLRDQRYEAVVHLVTAAIGAERFYTLENNKARMESRPEAIALDGRLARAWVGHNALHVVENGSGSFEEKIRKTVDVVCRSLGVPGPRSQPRWWIVRNVDEAALAQLEPAEWKLEHVFLRTSDGSESRVTKKSSVGGDDLGVPRCCGAFTPSTRLVPIRRGRGWFIS